MTKGLFCILATLLLFSCQKLEEYLPGKDGGNNKKGCQIQRITQETSYGPFIATFYYNSKGMPDSIRYNIGASTGAPEYHFVYDNKKRLTQLVESDRYQPGYNVAYDAWHFYQYNNKGQIVSDTTYRYGVSEPGFRPDQGTYIQYEGIYYHTYTYDAQGRIVRISEQGIGGDAAPEVTYQTFTYNAAGNLERGGVTYSTAKNINQTNPIWQFLNRDYSVNAPVKPTAVNAQNLPLGYGNEDNTTANYFLSIMLRSSAIAYNCGKN